MIKRFGLPLAVLFGLNLVDEFDRIAFGVLTPELRDAFHLSDAGVVAIGSVAAIIALLGALPIGWLADRRDRTGLLRAAGVVWCLMAVLTGVAPVVAVLVIARIGAGLAHVASEPLHASLLGDLFPPTDQPRAFTVHRLANPVAALIAVPIGFGAEVLGWRPVFLLIAVPTLALALMAGRLREPVRGATVDLDVAARLADQEPVAFGEARRQLFAVRTLRRLWLGSFFMGLAVIPIGQLLTLFFEDVYGFSATERGAVSFVLGAATVVGLVLGERLASRAVQGDAARLPVIVGGSFALFGVGLLLLGAAPFAWASLAFGAVGIIGIGSFQPAYYALVGLVAPPRVRGQAYAWALVIVGLGGLLSAVVAGIGDSTSYRVAMITLAPLLVVFGGVQATARSFVTRDIDAAARSLDTARRALDAAGHGPLLTASGIEVAYDGVQVLFGIDLEVRRGEILALLGTNGAGKSTVLKALVGLVDPLAGAIYLDGVDITHADPTRTSYLGVVLVPGGRGVFPSMTVAEHVRLARSRLTLDAAELDARQSTVLESFPRLTERWDQLAGNLSGGEQQMLAVGLAFLARPQLLLVDELSLGLAPAIVEELLGMIRRLNAEGTTIVLVEQSVNLALTVADRAYFLEKGEVRFEGPTAELLDRGDILRAVFLGTGDREPGPSRTSAVSPDDVPALEVCRLGRSFGGIRAVDDVSFTVAPGEVVGIIGANGAGKTTVFDLISGFLPPDTGTVHLGGRDVTELRAAARGRAGLGRSFQDARIFPSLTVLENVAVALERRLETRDMAADALGLPSSRDVERDVRHTAEALVELLNLGAFADKLVGELSTGSRRIVDLAMVLAHQPSVLLFDEPSSGIAQREAEALGPLLLRIREATGAAMVVIEHDMPLITTLSDRMLALEAGRLIASGTPAEVLADDQVVRGYLGGDVAAVRRSGVKAPA